MKTGLLLSLILSANMLFAEKMNVVFFLIDDLSHYGITAYGANRISSVEGFFDKVVFETPRIDSLAAEGLRCDYANAYPLCEPTRVALMSGMNNYRNFHKPKSLHASDITFGDLFRQAGYETCIVGKWKQSRGTKQIPGKDYISEFGWDEFCCFDVITEGRRMIEPDLVINGKVTNLRGVDPETGRRWFGPDVFSRYALDFIDRNKDKPFFLYYPMVLVHDEHTPTPDTRPLGLYDEFDIQQSNEWGYYKGDDRRYFPDMLAYMDKMVGNVLDKLDEHGLRENTLVVVMGDNGTKESFTHILPDGSGFAGGKGGCKENGLHVPLLLRSPGEIPPGTAYGAPVDLTDILPTLCDAVGVDLWRREQIDGISFWPQAAGETEVPHREMIYTWYIANNKSTETEYLIEYAYNKDFKRYAPDADYPEGRFFDLRTDPLEEAGDRRVPVKKAWNKWHSSGLVLKQLTPEQQTAYETLARVLDENKYVPVKKIEISAENPQLKVGDTLELQYGVVPADASRQGVIWESSDSSVATVDKFGRVSGQRAGEVKITAYSWDDAFPLADNGAVEYRTDGLQDSFRLTVR